MARTASLATLLVGGCLAARAWLPGFWTPYNLVGLAADAAPLAIIACAMALCLRPGDADLSVEGTAALGGMVAAMVGTLAGAMLGIAAGMSVGAINGVVAGRLRWPVWKATLAMLIAARLITFALAGGAALAVADPSLELLGHGRMLRLPVPIWIALAMLGAGFMVRSRVSDKQVPWCRLAIVGGVSALAGIMVATRSGAAQPMAGLGFSVESLCVLALAGHFAGEQRASWARVGLAIGVVALASNVIAVAAWPPLLRYGVWAVILALTMGIATARSERTAPTASP